MPRKLHHRDRCIPLRSVRRGTSLVEVLAASLLVALVLVGALHTIGGAVVTLRTTETLADRQALAASLLAEVMAKPYEDPDGSADFGTELGEPSSPDNRLAFDDLDDFDDWSSSPPKSADGTTIAGFSGWTRSVDVKKANLAIPTVLLDDNAEDQDVRRITVVVTSPDGISYELVVMRSRFGMLEQRLGVELAIPTSIGVELTVGDSNQVVRESADLNHGDGP